MCLKIEWKEKESSGYADEIPNWMLADDRQWIGVSHDVIGPKGRVFSARCDVKKTGRVVELNYQPYKENAKEFDLGVLRLTFGDAGRAGEPEVEWNDNTINAVVTRGPISEEEISRSAEPFDPLDSADARKRVLASLAVRQGQRKFRESLKKAYQKTCAVTGCPVVEVLEAAHIIGYRGKHTNHVKNGLLLRADIHTLFDMGLIGVDPNTWKVVLHQCMQDGPYGKYHGSPLHRPKNKDEYPDVKALEQHLKSFGLRK